MQFMSIVLAHEIAHTLGIEEMYDNKKYPDHDGDEDEMQCIMEETEISGIRDLYEKIINGGDAFCEYCIVELGAIPDDAYES